MRPTWLVRAYAQSLEAPDKQVFLIPGAGHSALYTHPEHFREAVLEAQGRPRPGGEGGRADEPMKKGPREGPVLLDGRIRR